MASQFFNNLRILPRDNLFLNRNVGSTGQVFFNADTNSLQVYDGIATGGFELASEKNIVKLISNVGIASIKYNVTAGAPQGDDTGNKYYINNSYKPALSFIRGYTYVFNQTDSTNLYYPNAVGAAINQHPLHFSANDPDGELGDGSAYTANVIYLLDDVEVTRQNYINRFRFAIERKVIITVTEATPNTLYYYCSSHIGMGNVITVNDPGTGSGSSEGASIDVSDTAPSSPETGNLWLNTTNGILYVYQSGVWIQPSYDIPSVFTTITTSDSTILTPTGYDTLNFREGTNVELVSDPQTNSITINVVGLDNLGVDLSAFSIGTEGAASGNGSLQYNNTTGVFTYIPPDLSIYALSTSIPTDLTDLGIIDGTVNQVLTTDGNGTFTFETSASAALGGFVFTGTNMDTNDSSGITITPAVSIESDLIVENDLTVRNDVVLEGSLVTQGSGTPELLSDNEILLTATTRVEVTQTPFRFASLTTAQRDALLASNGDVIYNSTDNKFQGYENGSWANLI